MKEYIGVEIGGTKQQVASFDETGKMLNIFSERVPLIRGAEDILDWMKDKIPQLTTENTVKIGVGFGGIVDTSDGSSYKEGEGYATSTFQPRTSYRKYNTWNIKKHHNNHNHLCYSLKFSPIASSMGCSYHYFS